MRLRERRRARRYRLKLPLCRIEPDAGGFLAVRDISLTGARVEGQNPPRPGAEVRLFLGDGTGAQVAALGRVVREDASEPQEFAIEFLGPNPRMLNAALDWA